MRDPGKIRYTVCNLVLVSLVTTNLSVISHPFSGGSTIILYLMRSRSLLLDSDGPINSLP